MSQSDEILGSISTFAGNFAPRGYADCSGQILQINPNTALFSVLGTTYGGDGRSTFALPDLRPTKDGVKVDWSQLGLPRQVICIQGVYPSRG
jgi:microcystin-dependent protein